MKDKKSAGGILAGILLALLIVIALVVVLRSCNRDDEPINTQAPTNTQIPAQTAEPSPTTEVTATPEPTASPTPSPTPSPSPQPVIEASGSFRSDTGTALNLVVEWTVRSGREGRAILSIELFAESYSLSCGANPIGVSLTVDGRTQSLATAAVNYSGDGLTQTRLGGTEIELPTEGGSLSVPISASWNYRGSYGGTELNTIEAATTIIAG